MPYYFNLSVDKELLFKPTINYGGGVDSSQRFTFDYNQIISGGNLKSELTFDSNFEEQNNNKWLSNASLITNYKKNLNEKYRIGIDSALQTSKDYIQITKPNDDLSYTNSLSSNIFLEGFYLNKIDDYFKANINFYQSNQENEDNKTTPTVLPNISYFGGNNFDNNRISNHTYEFYNIFRDKNTDIHAQNQQKISHNYYTSNEFIKFNSKISIKSSIYNQIFTTENKLLETNKYHTGNYYRIFPIFGTSIETPFKIKKFKSNLTFKPLAQLVVTPGISNSNKLSNEDSTNNNFSLENINKLNRYAGTDKMDNSKRVSYGVSAYSDVFKLNLFQLYEFTENSNFHKDQGNETNLSDLIGSIEYLNKTELNTILDIT